MKRPCHECHTFVQNPFYSVGLVIGAKPGRVAFSQLEFALCNANFEFVSEHLKSSLDRLSIPIGYIIGSAAEEKGAMLKTAMQSPLAVYDRFGEYKFLEKEQALRDLPTTAGDLLAKPVWVEKAGNEWKEADWAQKLYEFLLKQ